MMKIYLLLLHLLALVALVSASVGCQESVCASVVSKCMLTQACKCDFNELKKRNYSDPISGKYIDRHCFSDCHKCLGELYDACCYCFEMCPENTFLNEVSTVSDVGDFVNGGLDVMFKAIGELDSNDLWDFKTADKLSKRNDDGKISKRCLVAYARQCTSSGKCRSMCSNVGGSAFRWFHDGCCECVGSGCINYGINKSQCRDCPVGPLDDSDEDDFLTNNLIMDRHEDYYD